MNEQLANGVYACVYSCYCEKLELLFVEKLRGEIRRLVENTLFHTYSKLFSHRLRVSVSVCMCVCDEFHIEFVASGCTRESHEKTVHSPSQYLHTKRPLNTYSFVCLWVFNFSASNDTLGCIRSNLSASTGLYHMARHTIM